ncbi:MAG: response regulator transcription factor [Chloroflexi bacterium]|nr:response regulator transcription factor [Chloroflexota bacterium]
MPQEETLVTESEQIRVLVAEDHTLMREMTRQLLEQGGIAVVGEASDGVEAVALSRQHHPHIVLMDVAMPRLNGVEATRQIKESCASTAVLVLTAYDDDQYVTALLEAGAAGYLLKTIKPAELLEALRRVYAGESVLHPKIAKKVLQRFSPRSQARETSSVTESLSEREKDVLRLAAQGKGNKEIAVHLSLSDRTVQAHLSRIFNKLGVASRTEAVIKGLRQGWLRLEDIGDG